MKRSLGPDFEEMELAKVKSELARGSEVFSREALSLPDLLEGDRVIFETIDGTYAGTVLEDWTEGSLPSPLVTVMLDSRPGRPVVFHRTLFRRFSVLDHLAES